MPAGDPPAGEERRTRAPKTSRGRQTRERILATAARLVNAHGVNAVSVEQVLTASGTGKGQLYHYFATKADLVREVLAYQLDRVIEGQAAVLERLDTWEGIEAWLDAVVAEHERRGYVGGCPIGSLAAEMADQDEALRRELVRAFDHWESFLAAGLRSMREDGTLRPDADPERLAEVTMASLQGGYLLATTRRETRPLRDALAAALAHLRSYSSDQR